jgi:hypothetical protein
MKNALKNLSGKSEDSLEDIKIMLNQASECKI